MRLHRFYTTEKLEGYNDLNNGSGKDSGVFVLPDEALAHQLRSVFRLRTGAQIVLFDGTGFDYKVEITALGKAEVSFCILEIISVKRAEKHSVKPRLTLVFSLIKKDNAEWVIEKGTELGVSEFIPVISERSEKKGFNMERAQKKIIEACEQSGRSEIATIHEPIELADFIVANMSQLNNKGHVIVFHTDGKIFNRISSVNNASDVIACVGPEGGWTDKEIAMFTAAGATIAKLDTPVLRAETASVAVATLLLA